MLPPERKQKPDKARDLFGVLGAMAFLTICGGLLLTEMSAGDRWISGLLLVLIVVQLCKR